MQGQSDVEQGLVVRRERGLMYEDFEVGQIIDHHWGRTVTKAESITFSSMTMSFTPQYFDAEYAKHLGYEDVVINPMFAYVVVLGLSVEDLSEAGGPFLGVDDLRFGVPVYDGDTIRASSTTLSMRGSGSHPGWGIVEWRTIGRNQRGEQVLEYRRHNLSRMRRSKDDR